MGFLADLDSALDANPKVATIYMGEGALHAFWADRCARDDVGRANIARIRNSWRTTSYRGIPVIPTDWPFGWEIAEAA